jgi:hypothetical protein
MRKVVAVWLMFMLLIGTAPIGQALPDWAWISGEEFAFATDMDTTSDGAIDMGRFETESVFNLSAVDAQMPGSEQIEIMTANNIADLKATIDAKAVTVISGLETMAAEFERNLAAARRIMDSGGFLAPIDAPDPNATPIYTAQDLYDIRNNLSGSYVLMNDIDLSDFNGGRWIPIGNGDRGSEFRGTLDGQGHVIKNLTITEPQYEYAALFGKAINATVKNVGLENSCVGNAGSYLSYVGGFVGLGGGMITIRNCYNTGNISSSASSDSYAGGILGHFSNSSSGSTMLIIGDCYNTGDISASFAGGILGSAGGYGSVSISDCYNTGDISASYADAGGILGYSYYSVSISDCYNTGDISASSAGGILGSAGYGSVSISDCYNTGAVSASSSSSSYSSADAGGILGYSYYSASISDCYNTGGISAASDFYNSFAGGISGYGSGSVSISGCYNTGDISAASDFYNSFAGGIFGSGSTNYGSVSISDCYNTGDISASSAGGILGYGYGYDSVSISGCYNTGAVSVSS